MSRADDIRGWRERWWSEDRSVLRQVESELIAGRQSVASVFDEVDGRTDLRGLPVTKDLLSRVSIGDRVRPGSSRRGDGPSWIGLDLTGADLYGMNWTELTIRDCVLDDANVEHLRCWGVAVSDTSMRRAKLYRGQLGAPAESWPNRSRWQRVDLAQADLRMATADVQFEAINFGGAKFTSTDFGWSDLIGCVFSGIIRGLTLGMQPVSKRPDAWTLTGVDLSRARPRDLRLVGVDLGSPAVDVRLPEDAEHWSITDWFAFLHRVAAAIQQLPDGDLKTAAEVWLQYARDESAPQQVMGFVAAWDLRQLGGEPLVDLLYQAR